MKYLYIIAVPMKNPKKKDDICIKIELSENEADKLDLDPRYEVIFTYPHATKLDKNNLYHYLFKYMREDLKDGEWFEWNEEIYGFFHTNFTIVDLRSAIPHIKLSNKHVRKFQDVITPIVNIMVDNRMGLSDENFKDIPIRRLTIDLLIEYILKHRFFVTKEEFIDYLQSKLEQADIDLIRTKLKEMKVVEKEVEEFNSISIPNDKMKYVCELGRTMDKERFDLFLNSIPYIFKYYYTFLGPEKIDMIELQARELEESYESLLDGDAIDLKLEIYRRFTVGDKLSEKNIRLNLLIVFSICQISDPEPEPGIYNLENYFDLRPCQVLDPKTGEQVNGFELLKKKLKLK